MLTWHDDIKFVLGETTYQATPPEMLLWGADRRAGEREFFIYKPRSLVERYVALIDELQPLQIVELGFMAGGSTMLFAELARPRRLVAVDREPRAEDRERVERCAAASGLAGVVRTFGEVDQADRRRLAEIVKGEFEGASLDLVVDDCSHLYEPTRESFNELFPRLRPGGVYAIEDWRWAHTPVGDEHPEGLFTDQVPLTRLLFEIALAIPGAPGVIADVSIELDLALIRRGEATVDPAAFDISACSNPRGHELLSPA